MNAQLMATKKQECKVLGLALSWIIYVAGVAWWGLERNWAGELLWLFIFPSIRWMLFHNFISISRFLGYGRIEDRLPVNPGDAKSAVVTFYSFFGCPFCPIVLQRLEVLQKQMGFTLQRVDITRNPQILISKGIRSVPVVQVEGRQLVGNSTSQQLYELIASLRVSESSAA